MSDNALSLDERRRALLARALPLSASPEEAFLSVEVALLLEERNGVMPSAVDNGLPVNGAALAHDIFDPRAQAVLNRVRKAARSLTAAARKELEAILSLQPSSIGPRLLKFIQTYRVQLARLLTTAQVAALVQGAAEVAKHVPPVPPAGVAVPPPPTLSPFEAQALLKELRALPPMAQARRLYTLPPAEQQYVRQVLWLESTLPPTGEPPFWKPRSSLEAAGGEAEVVFPMIDEAVAILREKNLVDRATFDRLDTAARTKAFAVAGVDAQETLAKIQSALAETLQEGPSLEKFREKVLAAVDEGTFLSDAHLETVFRTNIQGALSDGKLQVLQQPYIRSGFPYARYDHIGDDRVRDEHAEMSKSGIGGSNIFRISDPVFEAFRPPWSWNCRCGWVPATIRQAAAEGIEEAQKWLATGIEPTPPAFVPWPPFRPPAAFQRAGMPLSVQLSMQSLLALEGEKIDEEPATAILPGGGLQPGLDPGNEPKNTQVDRKKGRWKGKGKRRTKRVARLRKPRSKKSAALSLEDQLTLIDACFAWTRTGTTNREGQPGWRNPDTGETRYQEIQPGTRKPAAPEQPGQQRQATAPAGKPQPQVAKPPGQVQAKKPPESPPQPPKTPQASPQPRPQAPQLSPEGQQRFNQLQAEAQKAAADPQNAINRLKNQMGDFQPKSGPAIKTIRSTQDKPLTPDDHEQVAAFHDRMAQMNHLLGQKELASANKEAADLHRSSAEAKKSRRQSWQEPLPSDAVLATATAASFNSDSLHGQHLKKLSVGGKDYLFKGGLSPWAARNEETTAEMGKIAGIPLPEVRKSLLPQHGGPRGIVGVVAGWVEGKTIKDAVTPSEKQADPNWLEKRVAPGDVDRQLFFSYLADVEDRHLKNYMISSGRLVSIDHEYALESTTSVGPTTATMRGNSLFATREDAAGSEDAVPLSRAVAAEIATKVRAMADYLRNKDQKGREAAGYLEYRSRALAAFAAGDSDTFAAFKAAHEEAHRGVL